MNDEKLAISTTTDGQPPDPGREHAGAPGALKANGQHKSYWVLTEEERAKGFVRTVRDCYVHVGPPGPKYPLRDLTDDEEARQGKGYYAKYEEYPPEFAPHVGRYWTQANLDRAKKGPCHGVTTMGRAIAETYARDPFYYGSTFCGACGAHYPVGPDGEFVWHGTDERVGT